jgi:hypothetical protein
MYRFLIAFVGELVFGLPDGFDGLPGPDIDEAFVGEDDAPWETG